MSSHDPQLLKGVLSMLLLKTLDEREDYGYAVVVHLQQCGFDGLAEGTVYPALTRLEKRGLLASRLVASDAGPARKYYRLTEAGRDELAEATKAWAALCVNVDYAMTVDGRGSDEITPARDEESP